MEIKISQSQPTACNQAELPSQKSREDFAVSRARMLIGLYRRQDVIDPETYIAGLAAVLAEYPESVIEFVTDPRTGIARRLKWLPSIAEVAEACDREKTFGPYRSRRIQPAVKVLEYVNQDEETAERVANGLRELVEKLRLAMPTMR